MLSLCKKFARAEEGLAALEFALIAPVMMIVLFGSIELSSAVDCNGRVNRVSSTVADLVAQSTAVSSTDVTNIFNCATSILYPYASTNTKIVVSSITYDATGKTAVAWSDALNTTKRTTAPTDITTAMMNTDTSGKIVAGSMIYAEVQYSFSTPINYFLANGITLKSAFYARPRRSTTVTHS